jgi:GDSL-like Lipase/Acylhydrolase family
VFLATIRTERLIVASGRGARQNPRVLEMLAKGGSATVMPFSATSAREAEHESPPPGDLTMQTHDTGTRSTRRLATGMAATLAVAILALATIVAAEHRENGRWVGTWSASPQAVASPVQTAIASDRHDDDHRQQWVGTWGNALHQPNLGVPGLNNSGFNNQTLRQIVHVSAGGARVRVRLSTFGASGLVIGAANIALSATGASIVPGSDRTLTFGGDPSITIPPGALVVSDPVELEVPDRGDLAVSIFVPENTGPATWHFAGQQTSFISPPGDFTASAVMPVSSTTLARFWLSGVDVTASKHTGVIVAIGESVVDGVQSTVDANARWTDQLARRLLAQPGHRAMGVLNEGLAGNRLLHDSLGPNALARFDRDVLAQTGVTHVIVQAGGNDIFTLNPVEEVTVEQVIQGHRQLIERAHSRRLRIFGCTLTPVEVRPSMSGSAQAENMTV